VQELLCPYHALDKGIHPYNSLDNPTPCPDNSSALRYAIRGVIEPTGGVIERSIRVTQKSNTSDPFWDS
jgi:hypothetical protein